MSQTLGPPLKGPKGHLSQIQCTHMAGWLDVLDPQSPLLKGSKGHLSQKCQKFPIQFGLTWKQETKGGWTSHRSCLSTASSFSWSGNSHVPIYLDEPEKNHSLHTAIPSSHSRIGSGYCWQILVNGSGWFYSFWMMPVFGQWWTRCTGGNAAERSYHAPPQLA